MLGQRLRELRRASGLTQTELAKLLGISQGAVTNWEKGKTFPDFLNQRKLADIYEISLDELLGREIPERSRKIPVLGRVQAGVPVEAIEEILDYEDIPANMAKRGEHFGLLVRGDSMYPYIAEGDTVIVHRQDDCESGDIAVVLVGGSDATVKKVRKSPDGITLIPINAAYEYRTFTNSEIIGLPVTILGKVVELRRRL